MKKILCLLLALTLVLSCQLSVLAEEFPTFKAYIYETEPNNSESTANSITVGGNYISGKMNSNSDTYDYYKFYARSGETYQVTVVASSSGASVDCFNAKGFSLGIREQEYSGGSWVDTLDFVASNSGYYYIRVKPGAYAGATYMVGVWTGASITGHICEYTTCQYKQEPTCTYQGYEEYICICGKTLQKNFVPPTGHTPGAAATCEAPRTCMTCGETVEALGHVPVADIAVAATCTTAGKTEGSHCSVCNTVLKAQTTIAALGHKWDTVVITTPATSSKPGVKTYTCSVCKKTKTESVSFEGYDVERIWGASRYKTSIAIANELKAELGVSKFNTVIIANGENFPDALAGSYLAAKTNAPILMVNPKESEEKVASGVNSSNAVVMNYINNNLVKNGKIYILGGTAAVPQYVEDSLKAKGYDVERLKGAGRYDTNLEILKEAGVSNEAILVCTGTNFADSLSASAAGLPILLVDPNSQELSAVQIDFLDDAKRDIYIIGGKGAVSDTYLSALKKYDSNETVDRVKGATRYETSVEVAKKFCKNPDNAIVASAQNFPDGLCGGPLAYVMDAPLILTNPTVDANKLALPKIYLADKKIKTGKALGGSVALADEVVRTIFGMGNEDSISGVRYD